MDHKLLKTLGALAVLIPVTIYAVEFFDGRSNVTAGTIAIATDKLVFSDVSASAGSRLANITPTVLFTDLNGVSAASAFATDNRILRSDGTGKGAQATGITVDDSDNMTGLAGITTTALNAGTLEFEGATADANETTLAVTDPTADRTVTLPDATGTVALAQIVTKTTASSYTIGTTDARELYGGVIYVTGAATITIPAVAAGASFTVITIGAVAVSVDPNASDLIYLDGTALADGDKVTNASTAGDIAVFTYYDGTGWYASTNSWTDGN